MDHDDLHRIREALTTGTVLGSDYFQGQVEKTLNRCVRIRRLGRPGRGAVNEPVAGYWVN